MPAASDRQLQRNARQYRENFETLNQARLDRILDGLRPRQQEFLHLLPLLFHTNHVMLPGYVSSQTPHGISQYTPGTEATRIAQSIARGFRLGRYLSPDDIHAMYIMGSATSIAFSEKSDLDIWICHDPELDEEQRSVLQRKASFIESWANDFNLEVHFFLVNSETFKHGTVEALSAESSGSAQHFLLLEEFYRSSILLAGRFPLWWLIDHDHEEHYEQLAAQLFDCQAAFDSEVIDFGGLGHAPAGEFFGSGIWQLSKGINSPYKSMLKIMLTEAYANEYPQVDLLGIRFKKAVQQGSCDAEQLDPYLMLYKKLEDYLAGKVNLPRLDQARRALYLKVHAPLTQAVPPREEWRYEQLRKLIESWGWEKNILQYLDNHDDQPITTLIEERNQVIKELSASYRVLSNFARKHGDSNISKHDLNVLGRKLFAAFERKAGKIEIINRSKDQSENHATIYQLKGKDGQDIWAFFTGIVNPNLLKKVSPLRRTRSLIELLCWCHFNRLISVNTQIGFYSYGQLSSAEDILTITQGLRNHFPSNLINAPQFEAFETAACITACYAIINFNVPSAELPNHKSLPRGNRNYDAFNFSGLNINLVKRLELTFTSSWGEAYCFSFEGRQGIIDALFQYLQWNLSNDPKTPPPLRLFSFSREHSHITEERVRSYLTDCYQLFAGEKQNSNTRYLFSIEQYYYLIGKKEGKLHIEQVEGQDELYHALAQPSANFQSLHIDHYTLKHHHLSVIYQYNTENKVQIFYYKRGDNLIDLYILDERGALFTLRDSKFRLTTLFFQLVVFFDSVFNRINILNGNSSNLNLNDSIIFYRIESDADGNYFVKQELRGVDINRDYFKVQAIVDTLKKDKILFTIYCDEEEFSTLEYGPKLFSTIADHIRKMRSQNNGHYPFYITDMDISSALMEDEFSGFVQTVNYLKYKQYIDSQLNDVLMDDVEEESLIENYEFNKH